MKKIFAGLGILLCCIFVLARCANSETFKLDSYVVDKANILSQKTKNDILEKIKNIKTSDGTQIVVVTIPSLNGESIEEYSIKLAQENGIGEKGKDNGVLFLVAMKEHKMRIEVGYGLEGKLTDVISSHIIDDVKPYFKKNDFNGGVTLAVDNIIKVVKGEYKVEDKGITGADILWFIFIIIVILIIVAVVFGGSGIFIGMSSGDSSSGGFDRFGGGGFGGGGNSGGW